MLARLTRSALLGQDLSQIMDEAVALVSDALDVEVCSVLELLPDQRAFLLTAGHGWRPGVVGHATVEAGVPSLASYTLLPDHSPVIVQDLAHETRFPVPPLLLEHGLISSISVALVAPDGRPFGVLAAHTRTRRTFARNAVEFLEAVGTILTAAVQRLRHEERLALLARIVENSHDAIIAKHLDGTVTEWNRGAERIYGYTAAEMVGTSISRLVPPERVDELPGICHRLARGEIVEPFETIRITKDGTPIPVIVTISPLFDAQGRVTGASSIARDISHIKDAQRRLVELTRTLEQRVVERTQELVASQNMLRQMASKLTLTELRERRQIATELHDYLAQLLVVGRLKVGQLLPVIGSRPAAATLTELDHILDESLTYTRTLVAELSPTVLYELGLAAALQWLGDQMLRHELRVEVEIVQADSDFSVPEDYAVLIYQTVRELLLNVLKHAGVGRATVKLERRGSDGLRVVVSDAGKGFDTSDKETIQPVSDKFGLFSISERLKVLGGRLEIDSAPGKGTTATVHVPIPSEAGARFLRSKVSLAPSHATEATKRSGTRHIRIALVDDHAMVRQGLRSVLEEAEDLEIVAEAGDGYEAVEMARTVQPDVVVMDINLPKLNGIEATRRILSERPSIAIIGISVRDDEQLAHAVRAAGARAFLPKGSAATNLMNEIYAAHK